MQFEYQKRDFRQFSLRLRKRLLRTLYLQGLLRSPLRTQLMHHRNIHGGTDVINIHKRFTPVFYAKIFFFLVGASYVNFTTFLQLSFLEEILSNKKDFYGIIKFLCVVLRRRPFLESTGEPVCLSLPKNL